MKRYDVRSSVCPSMGPQQKLAVTGLLLGALRAGDRQLQQRHALGKCGQCQVVSVRR